MAPNPLEIQELLEKCIGFVAGPVYLLRCVPDLMACALVARSWVDPAQSHLFRAPHNTNYYISHALSGLDRAVLHFCNALETSPHLIRHVRDLSLTHSADCPLDYTNLMKICSIPFTHLESLFIFARRELTYPWSSRLCRLFSLPSLLSLKLDIVVYDVTTFAHLWARCSPNIRDLELEAIIDLESKPDLEIGEYVVDMWEYEGPVTAQLDSLQITFRQTPSPTLAAIDVYTWALYPFHLSKLRALSIRDNMCVPWAKFAVEAIQLLDVDVRDDERAIDLSVFPDLSILRMTPRGPIPPMVLSALSTVTSLHHMRAISIDLRYYEMYSGYHDVDLGSKSKCEPLESKLSTLPMLHTPTIEFEVTLGSTAHEAAKEMFPDLISRGMLRFIKRREEVSDRWWRDLVYSL
ncbi:hypothetical protein DFH09DRAFT_1173155 [Mycena vulgaris]|nr:hypothetical protein DFH09DRAFT_1173155 [Mycena vulgaris]